MTVNVTAIPNTGSRRRSHSIVPDRGDDFVLGGGSLSYDGTNLTVGGGEATVYYRSDTGEIKAVDDTGSVIILGTF